MSGTLTFNAKDVARLIVHAADAPKRQATWTARLEEGARRAGVSTDDVPVMEWDKLVSSVGDDFDPPPALNFVHDQGLYVMSNGMPQMDAEDPNRVIYAEGFDPSKNDFDDWWFAARDIVGGDDFVEPLPIDARQLQIARFVLAEQWKSPTFFIEVDDDAMSFGFELLKDAARS